MKGAYVLILYCSRNHSIQIGSLGKIKFSTGYYAYVGSALGKNLTIESRVNRYRRIKSGKPHKPHWHIDYLLADKEIKLLHILPVETNRRIECELSKKICNTADAVTANFGSSDCRSGCEGHLYYFKAAALKRATAACFELK